MKQLLLFLVVTLNFSLTAQTEDYKGTYAFYSEGKDGFILDYKLQLNPDKTFLFTSYRRIMDIRGQNEYHKKGKGTWIVENKIIRFTTETSDLDENHTLNFSGTTARVIKKSPRDLSDKVVPTALQFYKSEIRTIENLKLLLKE
ncbi:MAG: hypothetical protein ACI7YS_16845 [Flavobacterium sp.]